MALTILIFKETGGLYHKSTGKISFFLFLITDGFRWVPEVFMSNSLKLRRMGRKLDLERDERFTFHLLQADSQVGNIEAHNVVDAIDHSKRVIFILST